MRSSKTVFVVLVMFIGLSTQAAAQEVAVGGRVVDQQGNPVQGARVALATRGRPTRTLATAPDGGYAFDQVAPGAYSLEVQAAGFARWTRSSLQVSTTPLTVDVTMSIGGVTESVEVMGRNTRALDTPSTTGSRLGLTPLETPASVQIVSGETIRERGDVTLDDTDTRLVGVTDTVTAPGSGGGGGGGGRTARGFSQASTVMKLYDGTQLFVGAGTITFPFDTWNIDRVEMLGGPASVMYGVGAIGGAINVVPRRPNSQRFEHSARVGFGSDNTWRGGFDSSGPLSNRVSYRATTSHNRSDGWVDRGDSSTTAANGTLRFDIGRGAALSASHDWGTQSPSSYQLTPLVNGQLLDEVRRQNYNVGDADYSFVDRLSQVKFEWAPSSNVVLRSVGTLFHTERLWLGGGIPLYQAASGRISRAGGAVATHDQTQYGNQTDVLLSHRLARMDHSIVAGVNLDTSEFQRDQTLGANPFTETLPLLLTDPGSFLPGGRPAVPELRTYFDRAAFFVEDRIALMPRLSVVGGFRVDRYTLDRTELQTGSESHKVFTPVSWRGGVVLAPTPTSSVYAQYSTATDALGSIINLSPATQQFTLTPGRQIEVGTKWSTLDGRLDLTLAGYRIVKENLLVRDPINPLVQIQVGQQSSQGFELTSTVSPVNGVRVEATMALLDARYDDFNELVAGVPTSRNGNTPPSIPERTITLWVNWDVWRGVHLDGGLRHVGPRYMNNANVGTLPGYTIADALVGRRLSNALSLDFRVSNLFDKYYLLNAGSVPPAPPIVGRLAPPRAVEVLLNARFR